MTVDEFAFDKSEEPTPIFNKDDDKDDDDGFLE